MANKPPIYLDNNATTPVDSRVIASMVETLGKNFGNPSSSTHPFGWYAAELIKIARENVASLINAKTDEIIFTSGATEANNLGIFGLINSLNNKPHVITVSSEHKSILDPLKYLESKIELTELKVNEEGALNLNDLKNSLRNDTALVCVMLANNEIGNIHPLKEITKLVRNTNAILLCDATQAVGKIPVDVKNLDVDLLSLSAHKFYGPKGIGTLYVRKNSVKLEPLLFGGGHERGLRSGTLNVPGIVALGKAAEIAKSELRSHSQHLKDLSSYFLELFSKETPDFKLNGPSENRLPGNLNISFAGIDNARLIGAIQTKVAISASSACQSAAAIPSHVLNALGFDIKRQKSSIRIGIGKFNTKEEIEEAVKIICSSIKKLNSRND